MGTDPSYLRSVDLGRFGNRSLIDDLRLMIFELRSFPLSNRGIRNQCQTLGGSKLRRKPQITKIGVDFKEGLRKPPINLRQSA